MVSKNLLTATKFQCPDPAEDRVFKSEIVHVDGKKSCKACCGPFHNNIVKGNTAKKAFHTYIMEPLVRQITL